MINFDKNVSRKSLASVRSSQLQEAERIKTEKAVRADTVDKSNVKALMKLHAAEFDFDNRQENRQDSPDF